MNRVKPKSGDITRDRYGVVIYTEVGSQIRTAHIFQDTLVDPDDIEFNLITMKNEKGESYGKMS